MSSKRSCWEIYNRQMSQLNHGDALWEPAPLPYFKRVQPGDVGYIRRGCFNLLFHAGCSSDARELGVDVPRTFKQLDIGPIFNTEPRSPGYLSTNTVRKTRVPPLRVSTDADPTLAPCSTISFQLAGHQGAALLTKHLTHGEDIQRERTFEEYTKEHFDSWVAFARETGHGNDIKPVLVTGVDMTRDFAMMSYSNNSDNDLTADFTTSAPGASAWGTWQTAGVVYTNRGPRLRHPPSPTQTADSTSSGNSHMGTVVDEDNQCVFVRYYTVRKRLGIPRVIRAAAGPHDLGPGGHNDGGSAIEIQCNSDSDSDTVSSPFDDNMDDDESSITSIETESDIVVHNTTPDERDDFDTIADYVFQNSDANSVVIHHRDIASLREPGGSTDLPTQLIEKRPPITVDRNGVGTIGHKADPPANTRSDGPLGTIPPSPVSVSSKFGHETINRAVQPEPQPPSHPECSSWGAPDCADEAASGDNLDLKSTIPALDDPVVSPLLLDTQFSLPIPSFPMTLLPHIRPYLSLHPPGPVDSPKNRLGQFSIDMVDCRKRRRNRTTQSCLSCHSSKRKCDRKRPCSRCVQLGLSGLCIYEVDDPAIRDDPNVDEVTKLRNRVAELESLVRELRGKPHPRWVDNGVSGVPADDSNDLSAKWHRGAFKWEPISAGSRQLTIEPELELEHPPDYLSSHYYAGPTHPLHNGCYLPTPPSSMDMSSAGSSSPPRRDDVGPSHYALQTDSAPTTSGLPCRCLSNPIVTSQLTTLTQALHSAHGLLNRSAEHNPGGCVVIDRITDLHNLLLPSDFYNTSFVEDHSHHLPPHLDQRFSPLPSLHNQEFDHYVHHSPR